MFDFRYHAISLVAVFLALGIGILLGVTIGDSLVSEADRGLRESLRQDVVEARASKDDASAALGGRDELIEEALPTLVGDRLAGTRVAVVGIGDLPGEVVSASRQTVELAGGEVDSVSALSAPPELDELSKALEVRAEPREPPALATELGERVATAIAAGGRDARPLGEALPDRFEGEFAGAEAVVFHRAGTDERAPETEAFEASLLDALENEGVTAVGAELSGTDPSQVPFYEERGIASVDSVDLAGGRAALALALAGAEGTFGFKGSADAALPDLPDGRAPQG